MAKLKICGITNEKNASFASELNCDFIGLIFAKESSRFVEQNLAKRIRKQVAKTTKIVGVFKNEDPNVVNRISDSLDLDLVQLHGSESKNYIHAIERPVIKVLEFDAGITETADILYKAQEFKYCSHLLLDKPKVAYSQSNFQENLQFEYQLPNIVSKLKNISKKIILAGGITARSAKIFRINSNPYGFDVCSSIEDSPGIKNHKLMKELVKATKY